MTQKLLLYGCGSMARAFALGLKARHPEWQFVCWTPSGTRAQALAQELKGVFLPDMAQVPSDITGVVLGFKPQMLAEASAPLLQHIHSPVPFVSLLAAVPVARLQATFPGRGILRLMPNLAVKDRQGVVLWTAAGLTATLKTEWAHALSGLGVAPEVSEPHLDLYTLPAASSPAFLFQWLKDAGEYARDNGGDPQVAVDILAQAWRGTLLSEELRFDKLDERIKAVASKGGVTQAALDCWQQTAPTYIKDGLASGLKRLRELMR